MFGGSVWHFFFDFVVPRNTASTVKVKKKAFAEYCTTSNLCQGKFVFYAPSTGTVISGRYLSQKHLHSLSHTHNVHRYKSLTPVCTHLVPCSLSFHTSFHTYTRTCTQQIIKAGTKDIQIFLLPK